MVYFQVEKKNNESSLMQLKEQVQFLFHCKIRLTGCSKFIDSVHEDVVIYICF